MKTVFDAMFWISYLTRRHGPRWRLIERAHRSRVQLFVSDYLLDEVARALAELVRRPKRFTALARKAVLRRAKRVALPEHIRPWVPGGPDDDAIVQTALSAKASYLVTADRVLLKLGKVRSVRIVTAAEYQLLLPPLRT